jgi:hypothetical protein
MSVPRLIPKVRQTAAYVAPLSSPGGRHLFGVDRDRAPAAASRSGKTGANPLLGQRSLKLRKHADFRHPRSSAVMAHTWLSADSRSPHALMFSICLLMLQKWAVR